MKTLEEIKTLETMDFQNRGGNYPKSDIADSIRVYEFNDEIQIVATFKNTTESTAKEWLSKYLKQRGIIPAEITTDQDGDYHNDWVEAEAKIKL